VHRESGASRGSRKFVAALRKAYQEKTGMIAECVVSAPTDGALALAEQGGV
jgi:indole-3-glycerol phosphate synthase